MLRVSCLTHGYAVDCLDLPRKSTIPDGTVAKKKNSRAPMLYMEWNPDLYITAQTGKRSVDVSIRDVDIYLAPDDLLQSHFEFSSREHGLWFKKNLLFTTDYIWDHVDSFDPKKLRVIFGLEQDDFIADVFDRYLIGMSYDRQVPSEVRIDSVETDNPPYEIVLENVH